MPDKKVTMGGHYAEMEKYNSIMENLLGRKIQLHNHQKYSDVLLMRFNVSDSELALLKLTVPKFNEIASIWEPGQFETAGIPDSFGRFIEPSDD